MLLAGTLDPDCWVDIDGDARPQGGRPRLPRVPARRRRLELVAEVVRARAEEAAAAAAAAGTPGCAPPKASAASARLPECAVTMGAMAPGVTPGSDRCVVSSVA